MRAVEIGHRLDDSMIVAYGAWAAAWSCAHRGDLLEDRVARVEVAKQRAGGEPHGLGERRCGQRDE